jgi:hypothetical protein
MAYLSPGQDAAMIARNVLKITLSRWIIASVAPRYHIR